ncbi:MAG: ImmA/IrrE family metallo-endopeptidase [Candidatus Moranbacteria bacterium]|nr:ImmA/IrrE family metallo-endopeptidase [Candidatus Moranbacteria bacterium]
MTIKIKVIKTEDDYNEALRAIQTLILKNPANDTEEAEKISILSTLIEEYETKAFPSSLPDPIDAILFRMEQQKLKPIDLVPFIGSRSKVSEVLSRKRPLTLSMIRSLEAGLGIPAKVLLNEVDEFRDAENINWSRFPLKEMEKRGYFPEQLSAIKDLKAVMEDFFSSIGKPSLLFGMLRKTNYRSVRPMDKYALTAWSANVVKKAQMNKPEVDYIDGTVNLAFMQQIAKLSAQENGPVQAQEFLRKHGVSLIIEPHFSQTYLDGATIMIDKEHPIIGLTLRKDALDNFWFNLMHELAHIALHLKKNCNFFYDDLDNINTSDFQESEADDMAGEALVPQKVWEISPARLFPSAMAAASLARELEIHTAIIAGKMRYESNGYAYLNNIINQAKVRHLFPNEKWN